MKKPSIISPLFPSTASLRRLALSVSFPLLLPFSLMAEASPKTDAATLADTEAKIVGLTEKARQATVSITHPTAGSSGKASSGSGTIISPIGLILTAAHVVRDADQVDIRLADGKQYKARVLGCDNEQDVALALLSEPGPYPYLTLEDKNDPAVGDTVVSLGYPGGFDPSRPAPVRMGHVLDFDKARGIRTDCVVSGGDSGGPLLNLDGRVIGAHSVISNSTDLNIAASVHALDGDWEKLARGERFGTSPYHKDSAPADQEADLEGLDFEKFRPLAKSLIFKSSGGGLPVEEAKAALRQAGLSEEKAKNLSPQTLAGLLQKAVSGPPGSKAPAPGDAPGNPSPEASGVDTGKLKELVQQAALSSGGKLKINPEQIKKWLGESGMPKFQVDLLTPSEAIQLFQKAMNPGAKPRDGSPPPSGENKKTAAKAPDAPAATSPATADLGGMDPAKFREILLAESGKAGSGNFLADSHSLQKWMVQAGMSPERAAALSPQEAQGLVALALQSEAPAPESLPAIQTLRQDIRTALAPVLKTGAVGLVEIHGSAGRLALGCTVRAGGFILTKKSEAAKAGDQLTIKLPDGRQLPGRIVKDFPAQDLALVKIDAQDLPVTVFKADTALPADGSLLAAPGMEEGSLNGLGLCSVADVSVAARGYFGLNTGADDSTALSVIDPKGPSAMAGLEVKDVVLALNGQAVATGSEMKKIFSGFAPGDAVKIRARRGSEEFEKEITLTERPASADPTAGMGVELSDVRTGFPHVIQTNLPLSPKDCGGILLTLKGEPAGLTIARASRTATYALPASQVAAILKEVNFDNLAK